GGNCREVNRGVPRPEVERERYPSGDRERALTPTDPIPITPFARCDEKPDDDHKRKPQPPDGDYDWIRARESDERSGNRDSEKGEGEYGVRIFRHKKKEPGRLSTGS